MASKADKSLFRSITSNPGHVLSHFLAKAKSTGYNLRPRAHVYELPKKDNRNFMSRILYSDIYWLYFNSFNLIALRNGPKLWLCQLGPSIFLLLTNKWNWSWSILRYSSFILECGGNFDFVQLCVVCPVVSMQGFQCLKTFVAVSPQTNSALNRVHQFHPLLHRDQTVGGDQDSALIWWC